MQGARSVASRVFWGLSKILDSRADVVAASRQRFKCLDSGIRKRRLIDVRNKLDAHYLSDLGGH
jgi:hypothetical protein